VPTVDLIRADNPSRAP